MSPKQQQSLDQCEPLQEEGSAGVCVCHAGAVKSLRRISSSALLQGGNEVEIDHDGLLYRLRRTALGKLILTK